MNKNLEYIYTFKKPGKINLTIYDTKKHCKIYYYLSEYKYMNKLQP